MESADGMQWMKCTACQQTVLRNETNICLACQRKYNSFTQPDSWENWHKDNERRLGDWQPIDTAPKNERILLVDKDGHVFSGEWDSNRKWWVNDNWDPWDVDSWMPLPEPPGERE